MFKNNFMDRPWTDPEKWLFGIISALLIIVITWGSNNLYEKYSVDEKLKKAAVLLGYNSALALGMKTSGQEITIQAAIIKERLISLDIKDISYPKNPSQDGGAHAQSFVKKVAATLSVRDSQLSNAFLLGWHGYINMNSPGTFPNFNIREAAIKIGYTFEKNKTETDIYILIIEKSMEK